MTDYGVLFRERGEALLRQRGLREGGFFSGNPLPGGHGLDDLVVEDQGDPRLLAFLHIAEKTAAGRFAIYKECVDDDPATRAIFENLKKLGEDPAQYTEYAHFAQKFAKAVKPPSGEVR